MSLTPALRLMSPDVRSDADIKPDRNSDDRDRPPHTASSSNSHSHHRPTSSIDPSSLGTALPSTNHQGIRSRITVVCAECKRLKLKCDRRTPCGSCVKRDTVPRCIYTAAASEKIDVQSLHNRVCQLETEVANFKAQGLKLSCPDGTHDNTLLAVGVTTGSSLLVSLDDVAGVWLDTLDMTLDTPLDLRPLEPELPAALAWHQLFPPAELFCSPSGDPPAPAVTSALVSRLPEPAARQELLAHFEATMAMHPLINMRDFHNRLEHLLMAVPPEEPIHQHHSLFPPPPPPQLAPHERPSITFFAVVAVAFALGAQAQYEERRLGPMSQQTAQLPALAEQLYALSQTTLSVAQRTANYDLDFLVAMRLQCLFLLHDGQPRVAHTVLPEVGRMVNIARVMGLHVDPDEHQGKYSLFEAEMRRRVWWDVYYYDLFISDCMGQAPLIDDSMFTCRLPSDCDDLILQPRSYALPPPSEQSNLTYFILKCKLAQLVKRMRMRSYGEPNIELAEKLETDIRSWLAELPPAYQLVAEPDPNQVEDAVLVMQRCELSAVANQLLLKVYHPFLRRRPAPHQAMHASVSAAHVLLLASRTLHAVLRTSRPAAYMFYSFGRQVFHAAVIAAHTVIASPLSLVAEPALRDLDAALAIMRDPLVATGRGPARGGVEGAPSEALRVVEMLRAKAELALRGNLSLAAAGMKRKHEELEESLPAGFQLPYVGGAVQTGPEDAVGELPLFVHQHQPPPMQPSVLQYPHQPDPPPTAVAIAQPTLHQHVQAKVRNQHYRHHTYPQPVPEPLYGAVPAPQWDSPKTNGHAHVSHSQTPNKERTRTHPPIGVRVRDRERSGPSRPRIDTASAGQQQAREYSTPLSTQLGHPTPPAPPTAMPEYSSNAAYEQIQNYYGRPSTSNGTAAIMYDAYPQQSIPSTPVDAARYSMPNYHAQPPHKPDADMDGGGGGGSGSSTVTVGTQDAFQPMAMTWETASAAGSVNGMERTPYPDGWNYTSFG